MYKDRCIYGAMFCKDWYMSGALLYMDRCISGAFCIRISAYVVHCCIRIGV